MHVQCAIVLLLAGEDWTFFSVLIGGNAMKQMVLKAKLGKTSANEMNFDKKGDEGEGLII